MSDTPASPPTSQWTVDDDGTIWFEVRPGESLEPWEALPGTVNGQRAQPAFDEAYDALVALIRAAALNDGPDVEALRSVEPTAEQVHDRLRDRSWFGEALHDNWTVIVQDVLDARAALVREQTEGATDD